MSYRGRRDSGATKREVPSPRRRYDDEDYRTGARSSRDDDRDRERGKGGATKTERAARGRDVVKAEASKRAADAERRRGDERGAPREVRAPMQPGASRSRYALPADLGARLETRASFMPLHRAPSAAPLGASAPASIQIGQGDVHIYDCPREECATQILRSEYSANVPEPVRKLYLKVE